MSGNQEKSSSAALEARHLTICLPLLDLLFKILALVGGIFPLSKTEFYLHSPLLPVHPKDRQCEPLARGLIKQTGDLDLVEEKQSGSFGIVGLVTGLFVDLDRGVIKNDPLLLDLGITAEKVGTTGS